MTAHTHIQSLDDYYQSLPDTRPRFSYPVHRDYFCCTKPVQCFDTWDEAATFAMQNDLFLGEPMRRAG